MVRTMGEWVSRCGRRSGKSGLQIVVYPETGIGMDCGMHRDAGTDSKTGLPVCLSSMYVCNVLMSRSWWRAGGIERPVWMCG